MAQPTKAGLTFDLSRREADVNKTENGMVHQLAVMCCSEEKPKQKVKWVWICGGETRSTQVFHGSASPGAEISCPQ